VAVNGQAVPTPSQTGWRWCQHRVQVSAAGTVALTGTGQVDELRLSPVEAQMTTMTYDPLVGMTSQTDAAGRTTFYEYDGLNRLVRTRDDQGRVLSQQQYHYAGH
jgi:YD repeat-containing protein